MNNIYVEVEEAYADGHDTGYEACRRDVLAELERLKDTQWSEDIPSLLEDFLDTLNPSNY